MYKIQKSVSQYTETTNLTDHSHKSSLCTLMVSHSDGRRSSEFVQPVTEWDYPYIDLQLKGIVW